MKANKNKVCTKVNLSCCNSCPFYIDCASELEEASLDTVTKGYVAIDDIKGKSNYYVDKRHNYIFLTPDLRKAKIFPSREDLNATLSIIKNGNFQYYRIAEVEVTYKIKE